MEFSLLPIYAAHKPSTGNAYGGREIRQRILAEQRAGLWARLENYDEDDRDIGENADG